MQTPEEQYFAQCVASGTARSGPVTPASHEVWRQMNAYEQAAHLARLDGGEAEAQEWERMAAERSATSDRKSGGWLRCAVRAALG
ncbi:hypothetical protein [Streptomyces sp. NPDC127092]|uniref:hypothetical protein n=1 Tax=Streptomyces sp. NPDC127092 TaxID=3347135 RepID=UPI00365236A6